MEGNAVPAVIDKLSLCAESINRTYRVTKTVCVPIIKSQTLFETVMSSFQLFKLDASYLQFVHNFAIWVILVRLAM